MINIKVHGCLEIPYFISRIPYIWYFRATCIILYILYIFHCQKLPAIKHRQTLPVY